MSDVELVNADGVTVFRGTQSGGGSQPVSVLLDVQTLDLHASGAHPLKWTRALNNPVAWTEIFALPAGLGLTAAFDGSSENITTTEAGTWALTLWLAATADDTFAGQLLLDPNNLNTAQGIPTWATALGGGPVWSVHETVEYPAGAVIAPSVETTRVATANPLSAAAAVAIVRLA